MIKIQPNVPPGCNVIGGLYDLEDRSLLGEDMVEVCLPNGVLVSAGWYPEGDPDGAYRVLATDGLDCLMQRETADVMTAKSLVEELVQTLHDRRVKRTG